MGTRSEVAAHVPRVADNIEARRITTLLEPAGRVDGRPVRLIENLGIAFEGCKPSGAGFVITPEKLLRGSMPIQGTQRCCSPI